MRPSTSRPVVVWIVDLEKCSGCFGAVGEWARLERLADYDLLLFTIGRLTPAIESRIRALQRTVVRPTTRATVSAVIGPVLANTKLLLDVDRIAVLVDSRASGQECGWSFEAQISAVKGLASAKSIRMAGTP